MSQWITVGIEKINAGFRLTQLLFIPINTLFRFQYEQGFQDNICNRTRMPD